VEQLVVEVEHLLAAAVQQVEVVAVEPCHDVER
jgi:hypothetical protein